MGVGDEVVGLGDGVGVPLGEGVGVRLGPGEVDGGVGGGVGVAVGWPLLTCLPR